MKPQTDNHALGVRDLWTSLSDRLRQGDAGAVRGVTVAVFLLSFLFFFQLYGSLVLLYDTDSYFHLAVAREYGEQGVPDSLQWARFSVMHDHYGDKEFLFHLLLMPFATWMDPELGGKLGLSLLNALIAATLANLSVRAVGLAGLMAPVAAFLLSGTFALRMIRLRPELLALLLLLWAAWAVSQRRWRTLGVLAFLYTLSHTAFHALLGLCLAWFCWEVWAHGRRPWRLLLYGFAGVVLALLLHPHFPANLDIWAIQNIDFFRYKQDLRVGEELKAYTTANLLTFDVGFYAALLVCWWSRKTLPDGDEQRGEAAVFWLAALPFGCLFLLMSRFATLFIPFAALGLFWEMRRRGWVVGSVTRLPGGHRVRTSLMLSACMLCCFSVGYQVFVIFAVNGGLLDKTRNNLSELGGKIPPGAKVAAPWDMAGDYVFWAPRAQYLNVLDPVFMAVADPRRHHVQSELFKGRLPDVPLAVKRDLDSDYIAFPAKRMAALHERVQHDPRVQSLVKGQQVLYRIRPDANRAFVLDWKIKELGPGHAPGSRTAYPRLSAPDGGRVEGFVDAARAGGTTRCLLLTHRFRLSFPSLSVYEFSPLGRSALWIDGIQRAQIASPAGAVLGKGVGIPAQLDAGEHAIVVQTCPHAGRSGFYLLLRDRAPRTPRERSATAPTQPSSSPPPAAAHITGGAPAEL